MSVPIVPSFPAYNPFWSFCTSCQCILMYLVYSYVAAWPSEVLAAFQVEAKQRGPDSPVTEIDWLHWVHFPTVGFGRTSACPSGEKSNVTFCQSLGRFSVEQFPVNVQLDAATGITPLKASSQAKRNLCAAICHSMALCTLFSLHNWVTMLMLPDCSQAAYPLHVFTSLSNQ